MSAGGLPVSVVACVAAAPVVLGQPRRADDIVVSGVRVALRDAAAAGGAPVGAALECEFAYTGEATDADVAERTLAPAVQVRARPYGFAFPHRRPCGYALPHRRAPGVCVVWRHRESAGRAAHHRRHC